MMPRTAFHKLQDLIDELSDSGVSEHTMLMHFFDYLPAEECIEVLLDLAVDCDFDDDDMEYLEGW